MTTLKILTLKIMFASKYQVANFPGDSLKLVRAESPIANASLTVLSAIIVLTES